jgi:hypothetical protein
LQSKKVLKLIELFVRSEIFACESPLSGQTGGVVALP